MTENTLILGAGMTGLAAGFASGLPVLEAADDPGGICMSYYLRPNSDEPLSSCPQDEEAYRFENGGGHWLFGGDPGVLHFIQRLVPVQRYARRSSVYFPDSGQYVPYPIQNHLRYLDQQVIATALEEMAQPPGPVSTMNDWLSAYFGDTLGELFFRPFHALYTAGLHQDIAPQDAYKSPVNLDLVRRGAREDAPAVGYNTTFIYPEGGLNLLASRMAAQCHIEYGKRVVRIDPERKLVLFADDTERAFDQLLSTLPLNKVMDMTGLSTTARPDPCSSVLVVNIGATRGARCPDDHWLYIPHSNARFHRVGFYSNVDRSFLPKSSREAGDKVSIYVERGLPAGEQPDHDATMAYCAEVVEELKQWGYIDTAEVVHPTWIEVAYTWSWPDSSWRQEAIQTLQDVGIYQVGRYARWVFQGIADSIRDGFIAGNSFRRFRDDG